MNAIRLGLIGYGEVGRQFGAELKAAVDWVGTWDRKLAGEATGAALLAHAKEHGVVACSSMAALCAEATLIVSAVTASQTLAVVQEALSGLQPGTIFLDLNSASPGTRQEASSLIEAAGGRYLEAGVMTSVPPHGIRVPMLLGGPHAQALLPLLQSLGMQAQVASERIGVASATKMCRSVMIKGLEALVLESYATARHYGVEDAMIATLQETLPGIDWQQQGSYFFSRAAQHGKRRAEEMREAARTVQEAGFEPLMASAIAQKHDWMAAQAGAGRFQTLGAETSWHCYADRLLAARRPAANDH